MEAPVYAPMDTVLETIIYAPRGPGAPPEYGFYFKASCEVSFLLDHIDKISDELKSLSPDSPAESTRTELGTKPNKLIKAGTLLGYTNGTPQARTFDFLLINTVKPVFHINSKRWEWGQAKNASCPYDYFTDALKSEYYKKIGVVNNEGFQSEGNCGSTSQDIAGTASGGWFKNESTDIKGEFLGLGQIYYFIEVVIRKDGNIIFNLRDYQFSKKKPSEIKPGGEACYYDNNSNIWAWLRLENNSKLLFARGQGSYPTVFPVLQAEIWER